MNAFILTLFLAWSDRVQKEDFRLVSEPALVVSAPLRPERFKIVGGDQEPQPEERRPQSLPKNREKVTVPATVKKPPPRRPSATPATQKPAFIQQPNQWYAPQQVIVPNQWYAPQRYFGGYGGYVMPGGIICGTSG